MDRFAWLRFLPFLALMCHVGTAIAQEPPRWFNAAEATSGPDPLQSQSIVPDYEAFARATLESDLYQQPQTLEQQLAGLGKRVEALEKPPIKYPANVQVLGVFQADGVTFNQDAANKL